MDSVELASHIDHTVLRPDAQRADVERACQVARELGFVVEAMAKNAADRARFGRAAWKGLNERMLATGAELVLVFHPDFDGSNGSKHMAEIATRAGIEVRVFSA